MLTKDANRKAFYGVLGMMAIVLLANSLLSGYKVLRMSGSLFYLDNPISLGTFFGTTIAALVAFINFYRLNYETNKTQKLLTLFLAAFFAALSFDEYVEIHEQAVYAIRKLFNVGSTFEKLATFNWIFGLGIFILIAFYMFFMIVFKEKDKNIKKLYLLGTLCFIGVMVFEVISVSDFESPLYFTLITLEESCEMLGVSLFFYASLEKLRTSAEVVVK